MKLWHGRLISFLNHPGKFDEVLSRRKMESTPVSDQISWNDLLIVDTVNEALSWTGKVGTIIVYSNESRFAIDLPRLSSIKGSRVFNYGIHLGDFDDIWNIYANYGRPGVISPDWSGRKTACMFASNKESLNDACLQDLTGLRSRLARDGIERGLLELYGRGWRDLPVQGEHRMGQDGRDHSEIKREISSEYCVQIALENTYLRNYVTEKFWQAADAGCLPIYLGSSWLDRMIDSKLYIDLRNLQSCEEVWDAVNTAISAPTESQERVRELQEITAYWRSKAQSSVAYARWTEQLLDIIEALYDQDSLAASNWNQTSSPSNNSAYLSPVPTSPRGTEGRLD